MNTQYPNLLSPFKIGGRIYKNRIIMGPFTPPGAGTGSPNAMGMAWFEERARGGAAQVTVGETSVDPEYGDRKNGGTVRIHPRPDAVADASNRVDVAISMGNRELTMAIQRHGAMAAIELSHIGMWNHPNDIIGHKNPLGPSDYDRPDGVHVDGMTEEQIQSVCERFADSVERAKKLGFDSAVIHGGHGWLQSQFLSPSLNQRKDKYGGSLENRARFPIMILDAIKKRVGNSIVLEYRVSGDELAAGGLGEEETMEFLKMIDGKVDLIHISAGLYQDPVRTRTFPSIYEEHACNRRLSAHAKRILKTPVAVVGAITDPELAEELVTNGETDMVVMVKQLIADPQYVRKLLLGRRDEIRPCIRCYSCMTGFPEMPPNLICSVNPMATREYLGRQTEPFPGKRRVLVVGGGVAGMKAAATAAKNGHDVTLVEKTGKLGGMVNFTDFDPVKEDARRLKEHLKAMVAKFGARVLLNTEATPEFVANFAPEVLITAVGSHSFVPPIPGLDGENVIFGVDAYAKGGSFAGKRVVIIGGGMVGCETGIFLHGCGAEVTVIEMADTIAAECVGMPRTSLLDKMAKCLIYHTRHKCVKVDLSGVTALDEGGKEVFFPADSVICALGMRANSQEAERLNAAANRYFSIGDCVRARRIRDAISEGYFSAMDI